VDDQGRAKFDGLNNFEIRKLKELLATNYPGQTIFTVSSFSGAALGV